MLLLLLLPLLASRARRLHVRHLQTKVGGALHGERGGEPGSEREREREEKRAQRAVVRTCRSKETETKESGKVKVTVSFDVSHYSSYESLTKNLLETMTTLGAWLHCNHALSPSLSFSPYPPPLSLSPWPRVPSQSPSTRAPLLPAANAGPSLAGRPGTGRRERGREWEMGTLGLPSPSLPPPRCLQPLHCLPSEPPSLPLRARQRRMVDRQSHVGTETKK